MNNFTFLILASLLTTSTVQASRIVLTSNQIINVAERKNGSVWNGGLSFILFQNGSQEKTYEMPGIPNSENNPNKTF